MTGKSMFLTLRRLNIYAGNGYCRSETVGTVFLQRASDAKRVYATVVHTGNNADGNKEQGEMVQNTQKVRGEKKYLRGTQQNHV